MRALIRTTALSALLVASWQAHGNDLLNSVLQHAMGQAITQGMQKLGSAEQAPKSAMGQPEAVSDPAKVAAGGPVARLEKGATFHPDYIVQAWRQPASVGVVPGVFGAAKGHIGTQTNYGGKLSEPGVAAMRVKLDKLYGLLLKQPPLMNVQGVSVSQGGGFGHKRGGPMGPAVAGSLMVFAFPINLDDKATVRYEDGTVRTPGEGDSLNIVVNDMNVLSDPAPLGTYNGLTVWRRGGGYRVVVLNTNRPLLVNGALNQDLIDPSRPASDIQFMVIYIGAASPTWSAMAKGKIHPASGSGRLLGVMFNTDWQDLLRQLH